MSLITDSCLTQDKENQVLYRMGYFEFSSLFWGAKEENEIKAVTEGKPGSDYNCAMFKIFNSTV